jgi:hypothetical protein
VIRHCFFNSDHSKLKILKLVRSVNREDQDRCGDGMMLLKLFIVELHSDPRSVISDVTFSVLREIAVENFGCSVEFTSVT